VRVRTDAAPIVVASLDAHSVVRPKSEETVMKTPKKVIEKISLPLMFVTFVMAVLVFAVSPVSAQDLCIGGNFCDRDDDTYIRDHKKCDGCEGITDCDDSNPDPDACDVVVSEGSITYTAQLTGAFVFGPDPIMAVYPDSKESVLLDDTLLSMDIYDGSSAPPSGDETWDTVFDTCPVLLGSVNGFEADDWYISKYGDVRVMFRDFLLPYVHEDGSVEDDGAVITVQLVGNSFDSDVENFLPVPPFPPYVLPNLNTAKRTFKLTDFVIWGNTAHGVSGPRRACQLPGGGGGGGKRGELPTHSLLVIKATRLIP